MTIASADVFARPMSISPIIVSTTPSLPGPSQSSAPQALKSPRKVRSDKGILKGPHQPRQPTKGTRQNDHWEISLQGVHGDGKILKVDPEDYELLMEMSDEGKSLYVIVSGGNVALPTVCIGGSKATNFTGTSNPSPLLPVTRFLTGERNRGLVLRHINHDPMDCRRANLIHEVKAKQTRHAIDWEKAQRKREECMEAVRAAQALQAPLFS